MNILYIFYQSGIEGKANIDIFTPAKWLIKKKYNLHLISRNDCKPYKIKEKGAIIVYPILPDQVFLSFLLMPFCLFKLVQTTKQIRPNVIISSGDWNIPILSFFISKIFRLPLIIVFRGITLESAYHSPNSNMLIKLVSLLFLKINYFIFNKIKYFIAISPGIHTFYKTALKRNDIRLINLECVDTEEFKPDIEARLTYRRKFGISNDEMVLFYGGNIEPYRRVDMLIYAFSNLSKKYPKLRLIISGYGKSKKDLIRKTNKLGLSKSVIFIDWLPRKEMPKLLSMVDVCIDTYPRSDWPTCMTPSDKLLEWMSSGKCVITSRVYSHSQIIKDGFNGLLYEPGSIEDLVSKLEMLFRNNEMIKALGNNARRIIKEKYDVRKVVPLFEDLCVNVLFEQYTRTTHYH